MTEDRLAWLTTEVDGRPATYAVAGDGPPVLFLHGWALGARAYRRVVRRMARRGCRVYAPAMPGFAGTADLPGEEMSIAGYGNWVNAFMAAVDIKEPALVLGHSFGGGVAIELAHSHPDRVSYLVLLNSVGGVAERPIWEWAWRFGIELLPTRQGIEILFAMRDDLVSNILHNPLGLVRVGRIARDADLRHELFELRQRGLPVLALTAQSDGVIPKAAFEALCSAVGTEGQVLSGRHSWLLADPDSFDAVLANVVDVRVADHRATAATTRATQILDALRGTAVPRRHARTLLRDAPPLWLMSAEPSTLASDLALCHPKLGPEEVRAVARQVDGTSTVRLTVAAHDRRGLLADTTAVLARHGLGITDASASTWARPKLALHALTVANANDLDDAGWERVGNDLRAIGLRSIGKTSPEAHPDFVPADRVRVTVDGSQPDRSLVRVTARDQVGLLWAICRWFAECDLSIESLHAATDSETAHDVFIVEGAVAGEELARYLRTKPKDLKPRRTVRAAAGADA